MDFFWPCNPNQFIFKTGLTRVCALVMRFVDNCHLPLSLRASGAIKPEEIVDAETHYIKLVQREIFIEEIRAIKADEPLHTGPKLLPLKPLFDDDGTIRFDWRLQYANCLPWESRNPVILPRRHYVTTLIVKDAHERCQHGGTKQVLWMISTKYWIISAREEIRQWERECRWRHRRKAIPASQVMAPLPELRTRLSLRAISQSSVDFAGPFITKQGRGKCRQKRSLCLFSCLATRAIHLELAYSMTTDSFLSAFYRMTSRPGLPKDMFSERRQCRQWNAWAGLTFGWWQHSIFYSQSWSQMALQSISCSTFQWCPWSNDKGCKEGHLRYTGGWQT